MCPPPVPLPMPAYELPSHPAAPPQAWYREGRAAEGLGRWEDAATAYFQASQLQAGGGGAHGR